MPMSRIRELWALLGEIYFLICNHALRTVGGNIWIRNFAVSSLTGTARNYIPSWDVLTRHNKGRENCPIFHNYVFKNISRSVAINLLLLQPSTGLCRQHMSSNLFAYPRLSIRMQLIWFGLRYVERRGQRFRTFGILSNRVLTSD